MEFHLFFPSNLLCVVAATKFQDERRRSAHAIRCGQLLFVLMMARRTDVPRAFAEWLT
jgi:hypothetical protein